MNKINQFFAMFGIKINWADFVVGALIISAIVLFIVSFIMMCISRHAAWLMLMLPSALMFCLAGSAET